MIPETVQAPRVVREDGRTRFRAPQAGVDPVGDQDFVTKGWALANLGGGGAPTTAQYILVATDGSLPNGRALVNSFAVEWDVLTTGEIKANLGSGVLPAVLGAVATYFSPLGHTHDATEIVSGVLAVARMGTGTPSSNTYMRGDGVWSSTSVFAAASHTHAASDITSGTMAPPRLGSGTANSTTFLRGDSAYSTIPTGAIDDNAITNAKLRDCAAFSVIGRSSNTSGDPADIVNTTDHQVMRRSGTSIGWGAVNLAQAAAVTGVLPIANGGTGSPNAPAALSALGAAAASHSHDARDITVNTADWTGFLAGAAGAGTMTLQELFDFIDANGLELP